MCNGPHSVPATDGEQQRQLFCSPSRLQPTARLGNPEGGADMDGCSIAMTNFFQHPVPATLLKMPRLLQDSHVPRNCEHSPQPHQVKKVRNGSHEVPGINDSSKLGARNRFGSKATKRTPTRPDSAKKQRKNDTLNFSQALAPMRDST